MKVAIVHEWLVTYAGSERVLAELLELYPDADCFAVVDFLEGDDRAFLKGRRVRTTFVQRLPRARTKYRSYLPLMPLAIEQIDLTGYDLVISSNHAVAKGVLVGPDQLHVCYCHSPMRYAWDLQHQYLRESGLARGVMSGVTRYLLHRLRIWDARAANGVDAFVANSTYIARRIAKSYRRPATVIAPPVDVDAFPLSTERDDYYVTASRHVPYKRTDAIVDAFALLPDRQLVVLGGGPGEAALRARAPTNVQVLGHQSSSDLRRHLQRARAFVYAAEEDFGIILVEAQACGTPLIAFGRGGACDIVRTERQGATGALFHAQTPAAIRDAVRAFEAGPPVRPEDCRANAMRFSRDRFRAAFAALVTSEWQRQRAGLAVP